MTVKNYKVPESARILHDHGWLAWDAYCRYEATDQSQARDFLKLALKKYWQAVDCLLASVELQPPDNDAWKSLFSTIEEQLENTPYSLPMPIEEIQSDLQLVRYSVDKPLLDAINTRDGLVELQNRLKHTLAHVEARGNINREKIERLLSPDAAMRNPRLYPKPDPPGRPRFEADEWARIQYHKNSETLDEIIKPWLEKVKDETPDRHFQDPRKSLRGILKRTPKSIDGKTVKQ